MFVAADPVARPSLRVIEHGHERTCTPPARFLGRAVSCDGEELEMNEGRDTIVRIKIADVAPYLGGVENAARILGEAADHHDFMTIGLRADRITYDNDAQYERAEREFGA